MSPSGLMGLARVIQGSHGLTTTDSIDRNIFGAIDLDASPENCLELLRTAMREDIGVLVQVTDFARARQAFYRARADAEDPGLAVLQFRASPGLAGGNLIIVKEKISLTPERETTHDL